MGRQRYPAANCGGATQADRAKTSEDGLMIAVPSSRVKDSRFRTMWLVAVLALGWPMGTHADPPPQQSSSVPTTNGLTTEIEGGVASFAILAQLCTATAHCTSATQCSFSDPNDVNAYACFAFKARMSCQDAIDKAPDRLDDDDQDIVIAYFKQHAGSDKSCVPSRLQAGSFRTALWTSKKQGFFQHGIQILPSVAIGIPVVTLTSDNDAARALQDVSAIGGASVRYTPLGFWLSAHAFLGTASVNSSALDPMTYKAPKFLFLGFGVDTLSGVVSISYVHASLHPESLFLESGKSNVGFIQVSFDLTALGVLAAGAAHD